MIRSHYGGHGLLRLVVATSVVGLALGGALASSLLTACSNPLLSVNTERVAPPSFSPGGGVFGVDQSVTLASATDGATIYYTTDGSAPTFASARYTGVIAVAGQGTKVVIKAYAVKQGMSASAVVSTSFIINYSVGGGSALASPTFSPTAGVYSAPPTITLTGPPGASVYYTTDGSTPSGSHGSLYASSFALSGSNGSVVEVRAVAVETGKIASPVVSASYHIDYSQVSTPQFSPLSGLFTADVNGIVISAPSAPTGTSIYYTWTSGSTEGTVPATTVGGSTSLYSTDGNVVTAVPAVAGDGTVVTVQAIATAPGYANSTIAVATYAVHYPQVATPFFTPAGGTFNADLDGAGGHGGPVALSDATSGATILYTTDGSIPAANPGGATSTYSSPIPISGDGTVTTVHAIAVKAGMQNSAVSSATYVISYGSATLAPQLDKAGGSYPTDLSGANGVCISCASSGATIYYTTDGSMPSVASAVFTPGVSAPIAISGDGTVRTISARAVAPGRSLSPNTQATYAIHYPIASPTFSVAGGSFTTNIDGLGGHPGPVVISDTDGNADIYYTTNGSAPTTSSTKINHGATGTVSITGDGTVETINALAVDSTGVRPNSAFTTAIYSINFPDRLNPNLRDSAGHLLDRSVNLAQ